MRRRLTKSAVDKASTDGRKPVFLWDTELSGFGLKVTPAGRKKYVLQYRTRDQSGYDTPKRLTLGKHGELTPDEARKLAARFLVEIKAGDDPAASWKASDSPTVAALAARFLEEYLPGKKRRPRQSTIDFYEALFRCHVLPKLGEKRVDAVMSVDVERLHLAMRETPYAANRTLSLLQHAFDQAERWGWRPQNTNPAKHIDRFPEERRGAKREVMLSAKQMKSLMAAIKAEEKAGADPFACGAIRLAFWTGWRIGEILALRWENLDVDEGRAKLLRTKTAKEEYRVLPAEARAVLEALPRIASSPWVFPGRDPSGHLTHVRKPWDRIRKRAGLDDLDGLGAFRLHDLRHNVVSWDVSRGVALEIAGRNVGHRSRRSTEVYAHFAPTALKRAADERARAMREALSK